MNNTNCPCKRTKCERHGDCDKCREYHHNKHSKKSLTRCEKLEKKEQRTVNRHRKRS